MNMTLLCYGYIRDTRNDWTWRTGRVALLFVAVLIAVLERVSILVGFTFRLTYTNLQSLPLRQRIFVAFSVLRIPTGNGCLGFPLFDLLII